MTVYKRISSKKTMTGYSISVHVKDGKHVKRILAVLERYFAWADEKMDGIRQERIEKEVNYEAEQLKAAITIKDS